jgi:hypothetical protein
MWFVVAGVGSVGSTIVDRLQLVLLQCERQV